MIAMIAGNSLVANTLWSKLRWNSNSIEVSLCEQNNRVLEKIHCVYNNNLIIDSRVDIHLDKVQNG